MMLLSACVHQAEQARGPLPEMLRSVCERPDAAQVKTIGDLAAFSLRQEAALSVCDGRRAALVAIADASHAATLRQRRWWMWSQKIK
jgi:hypothetical protein